MPERTDPAEALKRINWHLNFRTGETLSLNEIANATGLAWGTVQKYTRAIDTIQNIAPQISCNSDGVKVGRATQTMRELLTDPSLSLAVYLFIHAQQEGSPAEPLPLSEHASTLEKTPETADKLESLGWIERTADTVRLTPLGIQIVGPVYADIHSGKGKQDVLKVDQEKGRAVVELQGPSGIIAADSESGRPPSLQQKDQITEQYSTSPYAAPYS